MIKHILNLILNLRLVVLLATKLLSIISCLYFIQKFDEYTVEWNFMTWLFPQVTTTLNDIISSLGTYILLVPVSIMIVSLLITDSKVLNIVSGFFGVIGTFVGIGRGLYTNTFGQVYNMKIFVVTHIATLERKHEIFLLEFKRVASEISKNIEDKLTFIQQHLTPTDFVLYDSHLRHYVTLEQAKLYAEKVVTELSLKYDELQELAQSKPFHLLDYVTVKTVIISIVILGLVGAIYYFGTYNPTKEVAELGQDTVKIAQDAADIVTKVAHTINDFAKHPQDKATLVILSNTSIQNSKDILELKRDMIRLLLLVKQCLDKTH